MRKVKLVVILFILGVILSRISFAYCTNIIQATEVNYPIIIDNEEIDKGIPKISIEDRIYLPIRAMCQVLGFEIEWNENGRVEVMTNKSDVENNKVEIGYYGLEGWVATNSVDLQITKETAVVIADDVFMQLKGDTFLSETVVGIDESDDGKCFKIYRYKEPIIPGENMGIIIRKSDGKILRIVAEE